MNATECLLADENGIPAVQLVGNLHAENESGPVKLRRLLD
jgi:hypothetical protein